MSNDRWVSKQPLTSAHCPSEAEVCFDEGGAREGLGIPKPGGCHRLPRASLGWGGCWWPQSPPRLRWLLSQRSSGHREGSLVPLRAEAAPRRDPEPSSKGARRPGAPGGAAARLPHVVSRHQPQEEEVPCVTMRRDLHEGAPNLQPLPWRGERPRWGCISPQATG